MIIKAKKLHPDATLPAKARETEAAWDLHSLRDATVPRGGAAYLDTGLAVAIESGYFGLVVGRRRLSDRGIEVLADVIDTTERAPIVVRVTNLGPCAAAFGAGEKVAQLIVLPVVSAELVVVDELD